MASVSGDVSQIEFGPCQVVFNNQDLGYFKGGVTFRYEVDYIDIEVDQVGTPVDTRIKAERAIATVPMVQLGLTLLSKIMPTGTYVLDGAGSKKKMSFGGDQVSTSDLAELVITPVSDNAATIGTNANEKVTIYKCIAKPQLSKAYNRDGERVVPVEFHGRADTTRSAGDQLFLLGDSTASA
jgi:hypothetical protein